MWPEKENHSKTCVRRCLKQFRGETVWMEGRNSHKRVLNRLLCTQQSSFCNISVPRDETLQNDDCCVHRSLLSTRLCEFLYHSLLLKRTVVWELDWRRAYKYFHHLFQHCSAGMEKRDPFFILNKPCSVWGNLFSKESRPFLFCMV